MTNTLNVEFNVFTLSSYKTFMHCSVSVKQQRNKTSCGFISSLLAFALFALPFLALVL